MVYMNKHNVSITNGIFIVDCSESTAMDSMAYSPNMGTLTVTFESNAFVSYTADDVTTEQFFTALVNDDSLGRVARALLEASESVWKVHYRFDGVKTTRLK